ncbi:hypothetical protein [Bradyrhizobium sp.]|uniref:hypothetical protein n=1 Tax=Bradyrhizobium sp. TaxID=376 RepID=UPI0025B8BA51|nr:hypothetical protein [Bradyrhizobium sp.]
MRSMSAGDWGQLLLLGLLCGGSFFFARVAVVEIPPLAPGAVPGVDCALALHLWLRLRGISFALGERLKPFELVGMTLIIASLVGH